MEPLEGLEMMGPSALSTTVVNRALRTVPYPLLGENTLCLSDSCILAPDDEGNMAIMFRSRPRCQACVRPSLWGFVASGVCPNHMLTSR